MVEGIVGADGGGGGVGEDWLIGRRLKGGGGEKSLRWMI